MTTPDPLSAAEGAMIETIGNARDQELVGDVRRQALSAAITAYIEATGMVLVPREPTLAMIAAGKTALHDWRMRLDADDKMLRSVFKRGKRYQHATEEEKFTIRWRAMLSAAPTVEVG